MRGHTMTGDHVVTRGRGGTGFANRTSLATRRGSLAVAVLVAVLVLASCASAGETDATTSTVDTTTSTVGGCADVVEAEITPSGGTYRVSATIRSADTGWEKYADAWVVRAPDGTVLGTRVLAHPHVDEQPFTRSLGDVDIPAGVAFVEIAARDLVEGFCGETVSLAVPGR